MSLPPLTADRGIWPLFPAPAVDRSKLTLIDGTCLQTLWAAVTHLLAFCMFYLLSVTYTELKVSAPWNQSFGASRFLNFFYSLWFLFYIYTPNIGFQNMFIEMVNSMTNACKIASNCSHGESWSLSIEFISLHKNKKSKILKDIVWGKNKLIQGPLRSGKSDVFLGFPP